MSLCTNTRTGTQGSIIYIHIYICIYIYIYTHIYMYIFGELQIGFQDVASLPFQADLYVTLLNNCGRGEGLRTATWLMTVVGGKQGHAPCKMLRSKEFSMFCSVNIISVFVVCVCGVHFVDVLCGCVILHLYI